MRQYGAVPSPNAAANTPKVSAVTGLGTKGGAGVQTADSGNFGDIYVYPDIDAATGGSVSLTFPSTPPTLFISGSEGFGTITQNTTLFVVTISWTGKPKPYRHQLHYEWQNYTKAN